MIASGLRYFAKGPGRRVRRRHELLEVNCHQEPPQRQRIASDISDEDALRELLALNGGGL